jgi:ABC-type molybdate transport system substrate-binding protein
MRASGHDPRSTASAAVRPSRSITFAITFAITAVLALPTASFAQVKVIISGGFSAAYRELLPEFERTSGVTVTTTTGGSQGNGPNTIGAQLRRGVAADVGIYLTMRLFPRLGIADEMAGKSTTSGVAAVASGDAEIAVQPVSELLSVRGVDFVGTIPAEVQYVAVFAAAVVAGSKEPDVSKRLIEFLSSEGATAALKKSGMEPSRPR